MDSDGVCLQTTGYTCGPAAAVTALRRLGFKADEGQLAILTHCTSFTGTPPDILADSLQSRYGRNGLRCEYRGFRDVAELKNAGLTLAVVKFNFIVDHYVTVLAVNDHTVTIGDPLYGLTEMSRHDFEDMWRFCGVALARR
jgi:predicted double-glycine peptidase